MIPKIIFFVLMLAVTITLVQGLPRTHRFKPVVNLNPEKLNTTEKPIELRKSSLFPKNNIKYVVTDRPLRRITAPSSYKYYLAKRPLLLKFESSSPLGRQDQPVPHQSLMKKVKFVVSTPSPYERNYWENKRPIHIRNNDTNVVNNTVLQKNHENKDHQLPTNMTTTHSTEPPKKEIVENILLPVNEEEFKSNPNAVVNEINDIIAFVNKLHETKENITNTRTTTQRPTDAETLITTITENSSHTLETTLSPFQNIAKTENNSSKVISAPEIVFIPVNLSELKSHPNLIAEEINNVVNDITSEAPSVPDSGSSTVAATSSSTIHSTTPTLVPENSMTTRGERFSMSSNNSEPSQYPNDDIENVIYYIPKNAFDESNNDITTKRSTTHSVESTTSTSAEFFFIPVKLENLKSDSYLVPNEVTDINGYSPKIDISTATTEITTKVATDVTTTSYATTTSTTTITPWIEASHGENQTLNTDFSPKEAKDLTSNSSSEIIFFPVNLADMKSHPNTIENEIKNVVNLLETKIKNKNEATVTFTPKTVEETTIKEFVTNPTSQKHDQIASTMKPSTKDNVLDIQIADKSSEKQISPEIVFVPVNLNDFKSHPQGVMDGVQDKNNSYSSDGKISTVTEKAIKSDSTENSTTESSLPTNVMTTQTFLNSPITENSQKSKNLTAEESPEVIFIPVNVHDLESNPVIAGEVKDIVNYMNKHHPHDEATVSPVLKIESTPGSFSPIATPQSIYTATENIPSMTESSIAYKDQSVVTTVSSVSYTNYNNTSPSTENYLTTESIPREIVFIPVNIEDFKTNPDLIADEVKDIVNYMNEQDKSNDNKTEQYTTEKETPSMKTTIEIPADTTTKKTFTVTTETVVTPKHIVIEPIEVTVVKDEDENDIYVGNIVYKPKYAYKLNDIEKITAADKGGKSNSISDDISDVVYIMKKNK